MNAITQSMLASWALYYVDSISFQKIDITPGCLEGRINVYTQRNLDLGIFATEFSFHAVKASRRLYSAEFLIYCDSHSIRRIWLARVSAMAPPSGTGTRHPASCILDPASGIRHPASEIWHPANSRLHPFHSLPLYQVHAAGLKHMSLPNQIPLASIKDPEEQKIAILAALQSIHERKLQVRPHKSPHNPPAWIHVSSRDCCSRDFMLQYFMPPKAALAD